MRQLSLQEINNVSGGLSFNIVADLTTGISGDVIQLAIATGLAYKEHAAVAELLVRHTFLVGPFANITAIASLFAVGYVATPYLFKALDSLVPASNSSSSS